MAVRKVDIKLKGRNPYISSRGLVLIAQRYKRKGKSELVDNVQYNLWINFNSNNEAIAKLRDNSNLIEKRFVWALAEEAVKMHFKGYEVHSNLIYLNSIEHGYEIDALDDKHLRHLVSLHEIKNDLSPE